MDALSLADYRARVAAMYVSDADLAGFRARRDELFAMIDEVVARTAAQTAVPVFAAAEGSYLDV